MGGFRTAVEKVPTMKTLDSDKKANKASESAVKENCDQIATEPEEIDFSNVKIEPLFEEMVDFDTFSKSDFRAVKVKACEAVKKSKKLLQFTLDDGTGTDRIILSGIHAYYEPEELVGKTLIAITNLPPRKMMGIAKELLHRVVEEARSYGCGTVQITASDMGVKLYTAYGFVHNGNFMQYKL